MMNARFNYTLLLLPLLACEAPDAAGGAGGATPVPRQAWSDDDDPDQLDPEFDYTFAALPKSGSAEHVPWPGYYWPTYRDSINYRWNGEDTLSPAKKYEFAFGKSGVEDAVSLEYGVDSVDGDECDDDLDCAEDAKCGKRYGQTSGACVPSWHGLCDAWAAAAVLEKEPNKSIEYGGVEFLVNDLKALMSLMYKEELELKMISLRCDVPAEGGELADVPDCVDTNPGTFHVALANLLGLQGQSFVEDRTFDVEVWNHPLLSYEVDESEPITAKEANQELGAGELLVSDEQSGEVAAGELEQVGHVAVDPGQTLHVSTSGTGDVDLYVRWNQEPTLSLYDCRPYEKDSKETCVMVAPKYAIEAYVAVRGYGADSTYEVTTEVLGPPSNTYAFNPEAVSLRRVRTVVSYVDVSPVSDDGHLSDDIEYYTRASTYEYVLELDGEGEIIGGEWLGSSKTEHPDFLYLPVKKLPGKVAKIDWADVKKLLKLAQ
jgi:hypothetical protein